MAPTSVLLLDNFESPKRLQRRRVGWLNTRIMQGASMALANSQVRFYKQFCKVDLLKL